MMTRNFGWKDNKENDMNDVDKLVLAIRDNPNMAERLIKATKDVKDSKTKLLDAANQYNKGHEKEILEGTEKRKLLLAEGKAKGLSEEEIIARQGFAPTIWTPILNYLYFMNKDDNTIIMERLAEMTRQGIQEYGYEKLVELLLEEEDKNKNVEVTFEDVMSDDNFQKPQEMEEFIYGGVTNSMFTKIKKLKALSRSQNKKEAFLAYDKCLELCKQHNLDFDKIPCNIV